MSKYGNIKTQGFHSKKEANRYTELSLLQRAGEISNLKTQVPFVIVPKTEKFNAIKYVADFVYNDSNGAMVVEDTKGFITTDFKLKQKLMYWVHGINILLT